MLAFLDNSGYFVFTACEKGKKPSARTLSFEDAIRKANRMKNHKDFTMKKPSKKGLAVSSNLTEYQYVLNILINLVNDNMGARWRNSHVREMCRRLRYLEKLVNQINRVETIVYDDAVLLVSHSQDVFDICKEWYTRPIWRKSETLLASAYEILADVPLPFLVAGHDPVLQSDRSCSEPMLCKFMDTCLKGCSMSANSENGSVSDE